MDARVIERLTEGTRLRLRSVKRGKITERVKTLVSYEEFNGELIEISEDRKVYFLEFPGITPQALLSYPAALSRLAELRENDLGVLTHNDRIRIYSVAQGMARRNRASVAAIEESGKIIPFEIRARWESALSEIDSVCRQVAEMITYEDLQEAEIKQLAIDEENAKVA
jgi:hypothetical protein